MKKSKSLQKLIVSFLTLLLIILFLRAKIFLTVLSGRTPLLDFDAYLSLIQSLKTGQNPYLTSLMSTGGPPLVFLYFLPFSLFNLGAARSIATLINLVAGFILCYFLAKKFFSKNLLIAFLIESLLLFSSFPTRFSLGMGQPGILMALLVTLIATSENGRLKGFLLASLSTIKTFFLFSLLAFFRKPKVLKWSLLFLTALVLVSLFFVKTDFYFYYFEKVFPNINSLPHAASGLDYYNQSLKNTLFRFGLTGIYQLFFWLLLVVSTLIVTLTGSFELSIVSILLLSPISWQHYFTVLFPIFVIVFAKMEKSFKNLSLLVVSLFFWWIEFPFLQTARVDFPNALLASHYFISGVILFFLAFANKKIKNFNKK